MILIIRIAGQVGLPKEVDETLFRMRIRRKYAAVLVKSSKENEKLLVNLRNYIAYGSISKEMLKKLIEKRGKNLGKEKIDAAKIAEELDKKPLSKLGLKPFFRLHPPRGGIESKKHFGIGKGVLGDNKEKINDLLGRML